MSHKEVGKELGLSMFIRFDNTIAIKNAIVIIMTIMIIIVVLATNCLVRKLLPVLESCL